MPDRPPPVEILVRRVRAPRVPLPAYQTGDAAGMDLHADLDQEIAIEPGGRALVPTGVAMAVPPGWEGQVRPRSGLALRHGVTVLNAPGTIDADYRGEVMVVLVNHGTAPFGVRPGDRIAQLVVCPVARATLREVGDLPPTRRGEGGYGSTGA